MSDFVFICLSNTLGYYILKHSIYISGRRWSMQHPRRRHWSLQRLLPRLHRAPTSTHAAAPMARGIRVRLCLWDFRSSSRQLRQRLWRRRRRQQRQLPMALGWVRWPRHCRQALRLGQARSASWQSQLAAGSLQVAHCGLHLLGRRCRRQQQRRCSMVAFSLLLPLLQVRPYGSGLQQPLPPHPALRPSASYASSLSVTAAT